ncbi:hypothetical protein PV10_08904 [Exophiala mesophila]|uniref:Cenp-O kinetochore centromere component n=1 Tax=Exophiala mesophila TaxID=212818 RepID=A0A0D1ZRB8_EXOME|nr:uncharacterized protein PV10_08904 [Exophiala mesophila]KIV89328.1 hypothetical protein PV10_08904 [Exophiala mesophila]
MALVASPPPPPSNPSSDSNDDFYDDEIQKLKDLKNRLIERRRFLAESILSSSDVHAQIERLSARPEPRGSHDDKLSVLLKSALYHSKSDSHRLAFGVTAFRFNDPSPECQHLNPLLGVRLDIRNGRGLVEKPYYMFCRRVSPSSDEIRIHRHTIPAYVPLDGYEQTFLPLTDEGYGGSEHSHGSAQPQNLEGLIQCVRRDLVSYTLRRDALDQLRKELGLAEGRSRPKNFDAADLSEDGIDNDDDAASEKYGIEEINAENADYMTLRIVWSDGRLGLIKVSVDGKILRAIVLGSDDKRILGQERVLGEGEPPVYELLSRLQRLHESVDSTAARGQSTAPSDASEP